MTEKEVQVAVALFFFLLLLAAPIPASAAPPAPAKMVTGFAAEDLASLLKWVWSLKPAAMTAVSAGRPVMKFEGGYTVETVFDGSKLGIEPFSVEVAPSGDLLVLDSVNSNIYRVSPPLSKYSRPRLIAGSSEGFTGHIDGRLREARMNHPKGLTVDDRGNIYVADTMNMAIRKISDAGVTTIAGGRWSKGGHVDGPSEDAKFSNDFEVVYVGSSCSLLVIDRGYQAIREIQLHFDDCAYQYGSGFPLGIAVLFAAGFFGYMLALLQRRVNGMVFSKSEPVTNIKSSIALSPYQKLVKSSIRSSQILTSAESEKQDQVSLFTSPRKLIASASSSLLEVLGAFPVFRRKAQNHPHQNQHQQQQWQSTWPKQESYVIQDEDDPPPPLETRTPTPRKTYAFMSKDPEKIHHMRHAGAYSWEGEPPQHARQQHLQQHRHYATPPQTYYEQSCETAKEIVFGAIQESDDRRPMEIKPVDYGDTFYDQQGLRFRMNYMGHGY